MNNDNILVVLKLTQSYLSSSKGRGFNTANPSQIRDFFDVVEEIWKKLDDLEDSACVPGPADIEQFLNRPNLRGVNNPLRLELRMVALMCLLGPETIQHKPSKDVKYDLRQSSLRFGYVGARTPPPTDLCGELMRVLDVELPDDIKRIERLTEAVVAFGIGKWRTLKPSDPWRDMWPGAIRVIYFWMRGPVEQVDYWLCQPGNVAGMVTADVSLYAYERAKEGDGWIETITKILTEYFCNPEEEIRLEQGQSLQIGDVGSFSASVVVVGSRYQVVDREGELLYASDSLDEAQGFYEHQPDSNSLEIRETGPTQDAKKSNDIERIRQLIVKELKVEKSKVDELVNEWLDFTTYIIGPDSDPIELQPGSRYVFWIQQPTLITNPVEAKQSKQYRLEAGTRVAVLNKGYEIYVSFDPKAKQIDNRTKETMEIEQIEIKKGQSLVIHGPVTLRVYNCTCGRGECIKEHRLEGWDLNLANMKTNRIINLWDFLASAVKGPPATKHLEYEPQDPTMAMGTNSVKQGMLVPMLSQLTLGDGRLIVVDVEIQKPDSRMDVQPQLILEGPFWPRYERRLRVRCKATIEGKNCNNLLKIPTDEEIEDACRCKNPECHQQLFEPTCLEITSINDRIRHKKVCKVDAQRQKHHKDSECCEFCDQLIEPAQWCSWCKDRRDMRQVKKHKDHIKTRPILSQRPTVIWVEVFDQDIRLTLDADQNDDLDD